MNIVDVIILLILGLGVAIGFKRGFIKQTTMFIGFILVFIIAYLLKNPVAMFMYEHLPFFTFDGFFKGVTVLNILLYEVIAFVLVLSLLKILLKILSFVTGLIEKILKFTIVLGIPSKILGAIVGLIQSFIIVFIVIFFLKQPMFEIKMLNDSSLANNIINDTPILKGVFNDTIAVFDEIYELKDKFKNEPDTNKINKEALDVMLKYDVVKVSSVDRLIKKDKLKIDGIDIILDKYR
ncbi:MAG: CvpA family protein [Bacilli bacterium]